MNKFVKKNYHIIIIALILIVYLINANSIIIYFTSDLDNLVVDNVEKIKANSNTSILYALNELEINEDIQHTVNISGWAFCNSGLNEPTRKIGLIFESIDGNTPDYSVCVPATLRRDVLVTFRGQINDPWAGVEARFSTVNMKNGIYKVYLYVIENETTSGIVFVNRYYQKDNLSLKKIDHMIEEDLPEATSNINFKLALGKREIDSDVLNITGWGFILGENCDTQKIYVKLIHPDEGEFTYQLLSYLRPDVAREYNNDMYKLSGFSAEINLNELPFIPQKFEIIIKLNNKFYTNSVTYDIQ